MIDTKSTTRRLLIGSYLTDPSSSVDNTAVVMDLRSIMDFKIITAKDSFILDIDLVNGTEQLRFKQEADADRWKRLLQEWKDFHTDYGSLYTVGSGVPGAAMSDNPVSAPKQPRPSNFAHENEMVAQKGAAGGGGFLGMGKKDRVQKDRDELDSVQVDDDEDADEEKGVRPLMKVLFTTMSKQRSLISFSAFSPLPSLNL